MKHCFIIVFCLLFSIFSIRIIAAQGTPAFPAGEKLTYNIAFANQSDAAFAELFAQREKIDNREARVLRGRLRTSNIVQATLLDLDADFKTVLDEQPPLALRPARAEQIIRLDGKANEAATNFTTENVGIYDLLSALYTIRQFDLSQTAFPNQINVLHDARNYNLELQFVRRETLTTAIGTVKTVVVRLRAANNDEFNRYKLQIHFTDDERRIPALVRFRLPQGEVRAELASIQILAPEAVAVVETPVVPQPAPEAQPTPRVPQPRPTPTPKPYVENQPLDADLPFALGERLTFEVSRAEQKIGNVALEVKERKLFEGRDAVHLTVAAQPIAGQNVFAATDKIESFIDPDYLVPFRHQIALSGALAAYNQTLTFDQTRGAVTNNQNLRVETPVGTHDVLSFVYAMRAFRFNILAKGTQDTRAAIFLGNAFVVVTIRPTRETIDVNGKKINALALAVSTGNPQIDSLGIRLWLSEDRRRLPLKLQFNTPTGAVTANLIGFN